jgi:hypothetical protein
MPLTVTPLVMLWLIVSLHVSGRSIALCFEQTSKLTYGQRHFVSCEQIPIGVNSVALDERSTTDGDSINGNISAIKLCVPPTVAHMPQTTIQLLQVGFV